jgi:DNA replication protein DnaC
MTTHQELTDKLVDLRLKGMADPLDDVIEHAAQHHLDPLTTLSRLADIEREQRFHNAIALRWRQATLTDKLTIDQFDFHHHTSRQAQKTRVLNLRNLDVARTPMDVMLLGYPGAGKTFLATCLASAACNANIKVLFTTATCMINHLMAAEADRSLLTKLQYYQAPELLGLDDRGS